jgi:hypothetical protein
MAGQALTDAALIARAEAAGVRLRLRVDGAVELEAPRPPPPDLLAALRARRDEVRAALVAAAHPELPPAWLAAMRHRAEAGRARIESHYGVDVAVFEPSPTSRTMRPARSRAPCRPRSGSQPRRRRTPMPADHWERCEAFARARGWRVLRRGWFSLAELAAERRMRSGVQFNWWGHRSQRLVCVAAQRQARRDLHAALREAVADQAPRRRLREALRAARRRDAT